MNLIICRSHVEEIVGKSKGSVIERVFIGVGLMKGDEAHVLSIHECPNVARDPRVEFKAEPTCLYNVILSAESRGLDIVLLIHSHPAPPQPSSLDLEGLKTWRKPWLIVDSRTGDYRAWFFNGRSLQDVSILESNC